MESPGKNHVDKVVGSEKRLFSQKNRSQFHCFEMIGIFDVSIHDSDLKSNIFRTENTEIDLHKYTQLIFDKGAKVIK